MEAAYSDDPDLKGEAYAAGVTGVVVPLATLPQAPPHLLPATRRTSSLGPARRKARTSRVA